MRKRLAYLNLDDRLIARDGGAKYLTEMEVRRACIERGFDVLGKSGEECRGLLEGWYRAT